MPRAARHTLIWSRETGLYELADRGRAERRFRPGNDDAWQAWLGDATAFAFRGACGSLNVYREARPRGGRYWYAYHTAGGRTRKRYLGPTTGVSLARLEEVAQALSAAPPPAPPAPVPTAQEAGNGSREASSGPARGADLIAALPATKLAPPRLPGALVARERLLAALDAAWATPLTLLAAPAGWGKTTLLAAWARRRPDRVAWLSLEASDDDPARYWAAVVAALRTRVPGVGAAALDLLRAPQPPPLSAVVTALLNELAGAGEGAAPVVLVLDDYQLIGEPAIHESVRFCLEHLPPRLRLLLASRVDPDLSLARLRARGQLAELRAADLRFQPDEAGAFLRQVLALPLAEDEVLALARRTEGWAAGLQLAALALRGQEDRATWLASFTGGHRYLLDYVQEELLQPQPPPIRRFLLQVAALGRLSAPLCRAVTGEPASQEILEALERANLFVVPLDERREWYRLHDLFREALLARAQASEPDLLPDAHRRAAAWHAAHGDAREAIAHAQAAGDHALAASLIEREAPRLWLAGEARTVHAWLHTLPDDVFRRHARLALDAALRLLESLRATDSVAYTRAQIQVERTLARVEAGLPERGESLLRRRLRLLRALIELRAIVQQGDAGRLRLLAEEAAGLSEREEVSWHLMGLSPMFWLAFTFRQEAPALVPRLLEVKEQAGRAGDGPATVRALVYLAHLYGRAGRLHEVERACLEALAQASRLGVQTAGIGNLQLNLADTYYAWNRLDEAAGALHAGLGVAQNWEHLDLLLWGATQLARLELARGDPAAADRALRQAEEVVRRGLMPHWGPTVAAWRARYWLATGDLARAARWSARAAFDPHIVTPAQDDVLLTQVRVSLARRRHAEALAALERFAARFDRPGDLPTTVEYLALRVAALHQAGQRAQARAVAARLLALTEPEGRLRVYLDAGAPMERALEALLDAAHGGVPEAPALPRAYVSQLLAAFEQEREAARRPTSMAEAAAQAPPQGGAPAPSALVEPLTAREQEVLRLLAAGASNLEIAAALSISPATAKKHVGNLLGKLGAGSRTRALARARELALL